MGRKRLPPGEARAVYFKIRMRQDSHDWLLAYAKDKGVSAAEQLWRCVVAQARREKYPHLPPER